MSILTAANQIGKSTVQIRKAIHWATCKKLWKKLWKTTPRQFWYLYPSGPLATAEFRLKWIPELMPKRGVKIPATMKPAERPPAWYCTDKGKEECNDPIYGWKAFYTQKDLQYVLFKSGIEMHFKTYTQNVHNLQAGTVHAIFCDEELPEELYDELTFRLEAVDGYFSMVFTATRNQVLWLLAMEAKGDMEKFPDAHKQQITMYDCQKFEDGTLSKWTDEKIAKAKAKCKNETEVQRRVYGKFVQDQGRVYGQFDPQKHFVPATTKLPERCSYYGAMDYGSGGLEGHPSAASILAVAPDFREVWVVRGIRLDEQQTTAGDLIQHYLDLKGKTPITQQTYDPACRDLLTISERIGLSLLKPDKGTDIGEGLVNTLFRHNRLHIFDTPELRKLGNELMTIMKETPKRKRKDDFADTVRYGLTIIPIDWEYFRGEPSEIEKKQKREEWHPPTDDEIIAEQIRIRRGESPKTDRDREASRAEREWYRELDDANEEYGT